MMMGIGMSMKRGPMIQEELVAESPAKEKDIVDSRALQHCRLDTLPNNASDFRAWKNSLYLTMETWTLVV